MAARPWLLLATDPAKAAPGAPPGAAIARQMWDGVTPWQPPPGVSVVADDGRPLWQPAAPEPAATGPDALPPPVLLEIARAALAEPRLLLALIRLLPRQPAEGDPWRDFLALAAARTAGTAHPLAAEAARRLGEPA
jgi:hypothetical protein